ncbi:MAG: N-acetylmuramic acid 6-phosphate etherase [Vicinamibacterales bacterium]
MSPAASGHWAKLLTESRNPRSRRLDALSTERVVALLLDEDRRAIAAALRARASVARAARLAADTLEAGGDVALLGAGTSGRLAVLEAAECPPTFGTDPRRIRAVMAGGNESVFLAREGAEDREDLGRDEGARLGAKDLLIGISASSVTPFVRGALGAARDRGAKTVLVTCAPGRGLTRLADVVIAVRSGPEVLTGSTRLKAGSATKAVLNAITTGAMVRLGKAYENLMVDLKPTSAKLVDRTQRIVAAATGRSNAEVFDLLERSNGEVKTAIVVGKLGVSADEARGRLAAAKGHVRAALDRKATRLSRPSSRGLAT